MAARTSTIERKTGETQINLSINLDGTGVYSIDTGVPFFNHMLDLLSKHSLIDMNIKATGDIDVDYHHLVEDVGITLGQAFNEALGERRGINRYGFWILPMDDVLASAEVALDLGGRPYLVYHIANQKNRIRDFDTDILGHFWRSFCDTAKMNLHIDQKYGDDLHHAHEAVFKAVARALRMACTADERALDALPSSKGKI
ncbi:MAG: imidazoleglycerol-phosphate dehydratase HisB [Kiritimatiellaceae bacterium]|nr:imidazoleglycerol-phosphate dehydratase HisB [Kiritimatiellaceae bacterium]